MGYTTYTPSIATENEVYSMNRLEGKDVIITGASGGLGKQMALRFAQEGAKLAICARREKKLQETRTSASRLGHRS